MTLLPAATRLYVLYSVRAQFSTHNINVILKQPETKSMQRLEEQLGKILVSIKSTEWVGRLGRLPVLLDERACKALLGDGTVVDTTKQSKPTSASASPKSASTAYDILIA